MDQKKTGLFISDIRKGKGLTQKQLADEIGVSDKAVSRWETGRGLPDTAVMSDLCRVLEININELLSGERLSDDIYNGKAEEHMVELMKENEEITKEGKGTVVGTIIGIVFLLLFLWVMSIISGGVAQIIWFIDAPSILAVLGIQLIALGASGQIVNFFSGFSLVFNGKNYIREEAVIKAEKAEYAMNIGIRVTYLGGAIGSLMGFIYLMGRLDAPEKIGPSLAVCTLTLFYAVLIALLLYVIKGRIHKLIG